MQQYRGRMDDTSAIPWKGSSEFIPNTLDNLRVRSQSGVWVFNFFRPDNCGQRNAVWVTRTGQIGQNQTVLWDVYIHIPVASHSTCTAASRSSTMPMPATPSEIASVPPRYSSSQRAGWTSRFGTTPSGMCYLDHGAVPDGYLLQGPEDAVFVFRRDCHGARPSGFMVASAVSEAARIAAENVSE